jgi:LmbE family N-acetylglucosaminyl deacetylase
VRRDISREIRRLRPDLIITLNPHRTYNNFPGWHRDHRTTARVVLDCVYPLARDRLSFPELLPDHEPHKVREVCLVQWEQPRLVLDITDTMELKLEAIHCHESQVSDFEAVEARMRNRAAILGTEKGIPTPRGLTTLSYPGNDVCPVVPATTRPETGSRQVSESEESWRSSMRSELVHGRLEVVLQHA